MSGGGSTRLRDLVKETSLDWVIILPKNDRYGGSPEDTHLFFPLEDKSLLKLPAWTLNTLKFLRNFRPDVVHALKPHPFTLIPALVYKWTSGCRLVFDCDEWDPYTLNDNGESAFKILVSQIFTKIGSAFSDAILYANHLLLKEKIAGKYHGKCFYVPNGVDLEKFRPSSEKHEGFNILFLGMIQKYRHILPIVAAVALARKDIPKIKCIIVGSGDGLAKLKSIVAEKKLEDFFDFKGRVFHDDLPKVLALADVLTAPFEDLPGVRYQCNMKIFEYMGLGKPIVASSVGDLPKILGGTGYLVAPGDPKALAKAFRKIHENPEDAGHKASLARKRAEDEYGWKSISKNLLNAYGGDQ
ncbi:MAG TPA: glycosyltransferase [Candidatus Altiarchaeales archaeon]|nr:glycosyltransferase [Candidatus Altiarchaeales archaeon]